MNVTHGNKLSRDRSATILLVEDHALVRESLVELIHHNTVHRVVGSTSHGREAIELLGTLDPELILMDFRLGDGMDGLDLIKALRSMRPRVQIVVLSAEAHGRRVADALRCGANRFVGKHEPPEVLYAALAEAVDACASSPRQTGSRSSRENGDPVSKLSDRERGILEMFGQGFVVREIAGRLGISRKTVEAHRTNIRGKLEIPTSLELRGFARSYFGGRESGERN